MKKKGQFYLIAAIIIVIIIVGLSSVTNYVITRKKPVKFYDLSDELSEESARVVDYGIYNEEDMDSLMGNFTDKYLVGVSEKRGYVDEKEKQAELIFVYGNKEGVIVSTYTSEETGEITINYGTTEFKHTGTDRYTANRTSFTPELVGSEYMIKVYILGVDYNFNLQKGENFFFVITKKTEEETHIAGSNL
jgi:hypothetical protein